MGELAIQGATYGRSIHHPFYLSAAVAPTPTAVVPTPTNTVPQPTIFKPPTPSPFTESPTKFLPFITIAIKLDNFPEEVGWAISSDKNELIASKAIGSYNESNKLIVEKVKIPEEYSTNTIIFALLDEGRDGLCCDKGQGLFQVFVGNISPENLVAKGSKFTRLQHFDIDLQRTTQSSNGKINSPTPSPVEVTNPKPPTKKGKDPKNDAKSKSSSGMLILNLLVMLLTFVIVII